MNEIKCPKCGEVFKVDESGFADIVKQVRDREFEEELRKCEELLANDKNNAVKIAEANTREELQKDVFAKEAEIAELKAKLEAAEKEKRFAINEALAPVEKARDALANDLKNKETEQELAVTKAVNEIEKERDILAGELKTKDAEKG